MLQASTVPLLLALALGSHLAAQATFQFPRSPMRKTAHIGQPTGPYYVFGLGYANVAGDFDGDGDADVFLGNGGTDNRMLWNDGRARFRLGFINAMLSDATRAVAAADLDGDGDLDVIVGNLGQDILWLNNGKGVFTQGALPPDGDDTNAVAAGDIDGDGDADLVFGNGSHQAGRQNRLYLNDGKAGFSDATATQLPAETDTTQAVALGDVDGDGDLDLFTANGSPMASRGEANKLYLNDGKGRFALVTTGYLDYHKQPTNAVLLVDVDGDRDLDILEANGDLQRGSQNRLWINDGRAAFVERPLPVDADFTYRIAADDFDGDGDLDLYAANVLTQDRLYLNNGRGAFADATAAWLPVRIQSSETVITADFDGDGDRDLLLGQYTRLYLNDERRRMIDATAVEVIAFDRTPAGRSHAVGDVDGDGAPDLVFASRLLSALQNELYLNDGLGRFRWVTDTHMPVDTDRSVEVALADVDGDGDLDAAFANHGQPTLYVNDGQGRFRDVTSAQLPALLIESLALTIGDVEGDGDLDLLYAVHGSSKRLLLNDGKGRFQEAPAGSVPVDQEPTQDLVLVDVDGDRDLDAVLANGDLTNTAVVSRQNALWLNDGRGKFTDVTARAMPQLLDATLGMAAADVDADGDVDLLFANTGPVMSPGQQNRLYLNDGRGTFRDVTATQLPVDADSSHCLAVGDIDGDGDPDVVVRNYPVLHPDRIYLNDGKGTFTDASDARFGWRSMGDDRKILLADLDLDGDLDLTPFVTNCHRQLTAASLARVGEDYILEVVAEPGYAPGDLLAIPFASLLRFPGRLRIDPFGKFALHPQHAFAGPVVRIRGTLAMTWPLPAIPALYGQTLTSQVLVLHGTSANEWRFTNATSDQIVR